MKILTHPEKASLIGAFLKQNGYTRHDLAHWAGSTIHYVNNCLSPNFRHDTPKWMNCMCFVLQAWGAEQEKVNALIQIQKQNEQSK